MQNPLQNSTSIYKQKHEKGCTVACSCGIYKNIPHNQFQEAYKQRFQTNFSSPAPADKKDQKEAASMKRKHSEISEKIEESRNLNSDNSNHKNKR